MSENKELDLVWGVQGIADIIGRSYQQTHHMIRTGKLPVVKQIGERYVVSRQKLVAFFMEETTR
ncbi:MAG: hypothetical protein CML29_05055 [Rhizobiales bacterium]|nr:hypothetical protein [Hyphomicrobiales bacterium]MBA71023.1 hypothetical protein [Hyphomicrobiales bacterium]|tara:strand:- start:365 stop:556 length:192 start_codon:yes stop_codon:yes gene_type:complete